MKIDKLDLLKKGWSVKEIENASKIIDQAENKKHVGIKFLDKSIFWALLFILIVVNIVVPILVLPFLFLLNNLFIDIILAIIGFIFGILFTILIYDIEKLESEKHWTLIGTFLITGLVNLSIIINFAIDFGQKNNMQLTRNPYLLGSIYLVAFLIPYAVFLITEKIKNERIN